MFLIDTDVLSALRRRERNPAVAEWISGQRTTDLHLSVVSIGEIERGIARKHSRDPAFADALAAWLDSVISLYGERILGIDLAAARRWGRLSGSRTQSGTTADVSQNFTSSLPARAGPLPVRLRPDPPVAASPRNSRAAVSAHA